MDTGRWVKRNFVILAVLWFLFVVLSSVVASAREIPLERIPISKHCEDRYNLTVCVAGSCTTAPCAKGSFCLGPTEINLVGSPACVILDAGEEVSSVTIPFLDRTRF